jgi:hypothetical protein
VLRLVRGELLAERGHGYTPRRVFGHLCGQQQFVRKGQVSVYPFAQSGHSVGENISLEWVSGPGRRDRSKRVAFIATYAVYTLGRPQQHRKFDQCKRLVREVSAASAIFKARQDVGLSHRSFVGLGKFEYLLGRFIRFFQRRMGHAS